MQSSSLPITNHPIINIKNYTRMAANKTPLQTPDQRPAIVSTENQRITQGVTRRNSHEEEETHQWSQQQSTERRHGGHVYFLKRKQRPDHPMDSLL
jgi:hypothetical protein